MIKSSNFTTTFTPEYCEKIFHDALCNGLDYVQGYGIVLEYDENEYKKTRASMTNPCYEDVLMEMLRNGYKLYFTDYENDDDSLNVEITLNTVRERVNKLPHWAKLQLIEEQDDADTADAVLQTVAYDDIIFG